MKQISRRAAIRAAGGGLLGFGTAVGYAVRGPWPRLPAGSRGNGAQSSMMG
jgi:hypothetical protein